MPGPYDQNNGSFNVPFVTENGAGSTYNPRQNGVFGQNPLMSPKYSKFAPRDAEYKDTLARLYISLPSTGNPQYDKTVRDQYLASLPPDPPTKALAEVLLTGPGGGSGFVDFFLSQANEQFQEIMQVDKVLGDDYVAFFYGQQPPQFQYAGTLLNSMQDDQRSGFARAYQHMMRGTQLARRNALVRLRYDSVIVSGVMIATQQSLNADNELAVPFSFTMLVKEYVVLGDLPFTRMEKEDYITLAAFSGVNELRPIQSVSDVRVRTSVVLPPIPAAVSVAGSTPPLKPPPTNIDSPTLTVLRAADPAESANFNTTTPTSDVRGTVSPTPPSPPSPLVEAGFRPGSTP